MVGGWFPKKTKMADEIWPNATKQYFRFFLLPHSIFSHLKFFQGRGGCGSGRKLWFSGFERGGRGGGGDQKLTHPKFALRMEKKHSVAKYTNTLKKDLKFRGKPRKCQHRRSKKKQREIFTKLPHTNQTRSHIQNFAAEGGKFQYFLRLTPCTWRPCASSSATCFDTFLLARE